MTDTPDPQTPRKTGKRETAWVALLFEAVIVCLWVGGNDHAADAAKYLGDFIFPFTAYAFGLDWWVKQRP